MTSDPAVSVQGLVNQFGEERVHDGLDLQVCRGEILSIVGGSGSGKTVLLRTLLGLLKPTAGVVTVVGRCITAGEAPPFHRMGVVFQRGALWSHLTVCENVAFPIMQHAQTSQRTCRELAELKLRMAGLEASDFDKYPAEISGGMQKRAGLARALALDPALLLLDEPTGGLDPISASDFDAMIKYLHRNLELTVVIITHDLNTLFRVSERVAVLIRGRAVAGSLEEIERHEDPWIQDYFGNQRALAARAQGSRT